MSKYRYKYYCSNKKCYNSLFIDGDNLPEDYIKGLSVVVSDFSNGCKEFPTFGLEDKKIPSKIKEILTMYLPF